MRILTQISRLLVGLLFIFSGFIKANDPLGFGYKLDEYFEVFNLPFFRPFSLFLAITICVAEIILGFSLLMGSYKMLTLWLLLLMIVYFGFLTFYSAYYEKVQSCGCFGDAIPLTPWQSFYKDMALLVFIIILFIGRAHINPLVGALPEKFLLIVFSAAAIAFPIYTLSYLPVIDFRPYKIGTNLYKATHPQLKYFYVLKNKTTGEQKEFDKWPDGWDKTYEYVSNRTEPVDPTVKPIVGFSIQNANGEEQADMILQQPMAFLLVAYDLDKAEKRAFGTINDFAALCAKDSVPFYGLTASDQQKADAFKIETKSNFVFYRNPDDVPLKTMIRSNPGLMLIKNGEVVQMWPWRKFPSYSDVKATLVSK